VRGVRLTQIGVYLEPKIKGAAERVAKMMGVSVSEYVRTLVLVDLDRRGLLKELLEEEP